MPFAVLSSVQKNLVNPTAAPVASAISASGGQLFITGGYAYHVFTGSSNLTVNAGGNVEYLVVAGGGGGKSGGGGAGGALYGTYTLATTTYSASIGAGGAAATNGNNTTFLGLTATGGGKGGSENTVDAGNGGSGGGGGRNGVGAGGTGVPGQGNDGGAGSGASCYQGGGGGGAGTAGTATGASSNDTGCGGSGSYFGGAFVDIPFGDTGARGWFAGGGGASDSDCSDVDGLPGIGGGGTGSHFSQATDGQPNTGGGGGGASNTGKAGGSGIVIVKYATTLPTNIGMKLWLKPENLTFSGGYVSGWSDASPISQTISVPGGNEPLQGTGYTLNGYTGCRFNGNSTVTYLTYGGDIWATGTGTNESTVIAVYYPISATGGNYGAIISQGGGSRSSVACCPQAYPDASIKWATNNYAAGGRKTTGTSSVGSWYKVGWTWTDWQSRATTSIYLNNSVQSSADWDSAPNAVASGNRNIGNFNDSNSSSVPDGVLMELIVYRRVLTSGELTSVNTYLTNKYGI